MNFEVLYVGREHQLQVALPQEFLRPASPQPAKRVYLGDSPRQEGNTFIVPLVGTIADVNAIVIAAPASDYTGQEPIEQLYDLAVGGQIPFAATKSVVGNFRLTTPSLSQGEYHLFVAVYEN